MIAITTVENTTTMTTDKNAKSIRFLWKPQTDFPIPISNFNITGLYGVLMSVLGFCK